MFREVIQSKMVALKNITKKSQKTSIADPDSVSSAFSTPGSGMEKIRTRDKHTGSYFQEPMKIFWGVKLLKLFFAVADPGIRCPFFDLGSGIRDNHPGSATLRFKTRALRSYTTLASISSCRQYL
jgi:hypothetical protein